MTDNETMLLPKYLRNAGAILEFGCGSSTIYFLETLEISYLLSIETDPRMVAKLAQNEFIKTCLADGRLQFLEPDIDAQNGPGWGHPASRQPLLSWLNYTLYLWPKIVDTSQRFDAVLIDGRFRLATALLALIYLPDAKFLFHDYLARPYYYPLLRYINIMDYADSLIVYKRRNEITNAALLSACSATLLDPA